MKLSCDAVICDINRNWYFGKLEGFTFNIVKKLKTKEDVKGIHAYDSISRFLKSAGYGNQWKNLTRTIMKSIIIKEVLPVGESSFEQIEISRGVTRLYLYNPRLINFDKNLLCENCIWTCKQPKTTEIFSCTAYKNGKAI